MPQTPKICTRPSADPLEIIEDIVVLVARINAAHAEANAHAKRAIDRAFEAGDLLNLAKKQVSHGGWQSWLREHCPAISARTAQNYMKIARETPVEKRTDAFLGVNSALRLLAPAEPDKPDTAPNESIDFLPKGGETAYFRDDTWDYFIAESSEHPGYYYVVRFFDWPYHVDMEGWRDDEPDDSEHSLAILKREERGSYTYDIFRRPMSAHGVGHTLKSWKVADERWGLLAPSEFNNDFIESFAKQANEDHRRKTWPGYCGSSISNGTEANP